MPDSVKIVIPKNLQTARASLNDLKNVVVLGDWEWIPVHNIWTLQCSLTIESQPTEFVPKTTHWYFNVDSSYPFCSSIQVFPAKNSSIKVTFQHQHYNSEGSENIPWRTGNICTENGDWTFGRHRFVPEPFTSEERLRTHVIRALQWVNDAARGRLVLPGEPFELPSFPAGKKTFVFSEDISSFLIWGKLTNRLGFADLLPIANDRFIVKQFRAINEKIIHTPHWGTALTEITENVTRAIWIRLPECPVNKPWQAPITWKEFRTILPQFDDMIKPLIMGLADGRPHPLLIGFPIPETAGTDPCLFWWQGIEISKLIAAEKDVCQPAFRNDINITWMKSENWNAGQISTRGRLPESIVQKKILLIGAGALGSILAEQLVRASVQNMVILDGGRVEIGNLVRHNLSMIEIGKSKATSLAQKLKHVLPHTNIRGIESKFPTKDAESLLKAADIVIDCSGNDETLYHLQKFNTGKDKHYFSISLGFAAKRLFIYHTYKPHFDSDNFFSLIRSWLEKERTENSTASFPRENIGCWHAVYPARIDDIYSMTAFAVKEIQVRLRQQHGEGSLSVFEQKHTGEEFDGIIRVKTPDTYFRSSDKKFGICISFEDLNKMRTFCTASGEVETGGIFVGHYNETSDCAYVTSVSCSPSDSRHGKTWFWRGIKGLQEWLDSLWQKQIYYVGEWHYHPGGAATPSGIDIQQIEKIARSSRYQCPEPIMMIIGGNGPNEFEIRVFIYAGNNELIELQKTI